jgi:hypothetical protein
MVNLHIYPSTFRFESRILKETKSIVDFRSDMKIVILSTWESPLKEVEQIDERRTVIRIKGLFQFEGRSKVLKALQYIQFFTLIGFKFLFKKIDIVNCHSLLVLPIGVFFKVIKRSKLIYDTHELETERESLAGTSKKILKSMEKRLIRYADKVIVVNNSIGNWYKNEYALSQVYVVRNIPYRVRLPEVYQKFRERFSIPSTSIIFLYQGALMPGRAIEVLLRIFSAMDETRHIVFMGYGELEPLVRDYTRQKSNIHFHEAVKMNVLPYYTASADVGISLTDNPCLSYRYALGNKFFEFINAEVPFIFWDGFIEVKDLNDKYGFGWSSSKEEAEAFRTIQSIDGRSIEQRKINTRAAKKDFDWKTEETELAKAYEF